jgi:hypothetical protein
LVLTARIPVRLRAVDLLSGQELQTLQLKPGQRTTLSLETQAVVLVN